MYIRSALLFVLVLLPVGYADVVNTPAAGDMTFTVSGTERMRIDAEPPHIGIGTTSPPTSLTVIGTLSATAFVGDGSGVTNISGDSSSNGRLVAVIEDQKGGTTEGGTCTAGAWRIRDLNLETFDPGGVISVSSNTFTTTVDGWVDWYATAFNVDEHQTRLYNVSTSTVVGVGMVSRDRTGSHGGAPVIAGQTYRLEHRCQTTNTLDGFGDADVNFGGINVFSRVKFFQYGDLSTYLASKCDIGWQKYGGHCYYASASTATWSNARTACQGMSADLVRIDDVGENTFVSTILLGSTRYWIGATDGAGISTEDRWVWADNGDHFWQGEEWGSAQNGFYNNWHPSVQPDDIGSNEDCADIVDSGVWNDNVCNTSLRYICERDL